MRLLPFSPILVALFVLFSGAEAWAHPGHEHPVEEVDEFDVETFFSAAAHPFTGIDHLLAMLAVGALSSGGRLGVGIAFGGAVGVGFLTGLASPPWLLGLSLVVIGCFILKGLPTTKAWLAPLPKIFAEKIESKFSVARREGGSAAGCVTEEQRCHGEFWPILINVPSEASKSPPPKKDFSRQRFLAKGLYIAIAMIGFLHGGAHADGISSIAAGPGLCAGTMAGVGLGMLAARGLRMLPPIAVRFAGASVAVIGVLLTVARLPL